MQIVLTLVGYKKMQPTLVQIVQYANVSYLYHMHNSNVAPINNTIIGHGLVFFDGNNNINGLIYLTMPQTKTKNINVTHRQPFTNVACLSIPIWDEYISV